MMNALFIITCLGLLRVVWRQTWSLQNKIAVLIVYALPSLMTLLNPKKQDCESLEKAIKELL
jgi:hypothetical protein